MLCIFCHFFFLKAVGSAYSIANVLFPGDYEDISVYNKSALCEITKSLRILRCILTDQNVIKLMFFAALLRPFFKKNIYLFIYLFYGCVGSLFLCEGFR